MRGATGRLSKALIFTVQLIFTLCVLFVHATAQTVTGTLQGTVSDTNGAVVPNATVTVRNVETGLERTLSTNGEGFYVSSNLPLGKYNISATSQGFNTAV
ncbi:MAG TPA: carboxypeptidase-like regulatory domain-containing protein, partial [Pyrinomonadaceae bacterium]